MFRILQCFQCMNSLVFVRKYFSIFDVMLNLMFLLILIWIILIAVEQPNKCRIKMAVGADVSKHFTIYGIL